MPTIDLSLPVATDMPVYPGDPSVSVTPALTVDQDGVAVARLDMGSHTGTHLDAPAHSVAGSRTVDAIPLDTLTGPAQILRVAARAGERIGVGQLLEEMPGELPSIVCIATGWDEYFQADARTHHPFLDLSFATELWARGARVLGVDTLSPDITEGGESCHPQMQVHGFWLGQDGVIVENLARLTELPQSVDVSFLPLRIVGGDGSPIRAVAHFES